MRLIDADKASKEAASYSMSYVPCANEYEEGCADTWENAASFIHEFRTVDAEPVVHAKWENAKVKGYLCCSNCLNCYVSDEWINGKKWSYCPECGAKMDGE